LNTRDIRLVEKFRTAFKKAFGLSEEHYEVKQGPPMVVDSVFWTVYWDRQGFELNLLKKFETKLDEIAEAANTGVVILEMAIILRSLEYMDCTPMIGQIGLGGSGGVIRCSPA